jgi:hypothetical protein
VCQRVQVRRAFERVQRVIRLLAAEVAHEAQHELRRREARRVRGRLLDLQIRLAACTPL